MAFRQASQINYLAQPSEVWDATVMATPRQFASWVARFIAIALLTVAWPAHGWIENNVTGHDVRIVVDRVGKAQVEHRIQWKTNGNVRQKKFEIRGIDRDAEPLPDSYVVPARDAMSSSLESAIPLVLEVKRGDETTLKMVVDDKRGLRRGRYVFVVRYRTDLRARGLIRRDGALVQAAWTGPIWEDGFDNTRITFVLPHAPTSPRAVEPTSEDGDETLAPTVLSEVRRSDEHDEIELLRTYAREKEPIEWIVQIDPRALAPLPKPAADDVVPPPDSEKAQGVELPWSRNVTLGIAAGILLLFTLLVALKDRYVRRVAAAVDAQLSPVIPLPTWLRAPAAAIALTGGVGLQIVLERYLEGAIAVVVATLLTVHGTACASTSNMRGPGRWLSVSADEAWGQLRRPTALLDASTRRGKLMLLLALAGVAAASYYLAKTSTVQAVFVALDGVVFLALFGTGKQSALPADLTVEPARFLRRLVRRLDKMKGVGDLRMVPRIRIPSGQVDPDELRLLIAPRLPLRGFTAIEVGLTYAIGLGARVAMPEVLVRVVAGSPCDQALAAATRHCRITPGRKPDERVLAFSPRLPTVKMTAAIAAALAARIMDRDAKPAAKAILAKAA